MYSVDFIPTLDGAILLALIIDPRSFFSVSGGRGAGGGGNIPWDFTRMLAANLCYVLYMLWLVCVCSHLFIPSWAGQCSRWPWMGLRSFFPVHGGWYDGGLLCIAFTFVYFSAGFIWKNGTNVVSSLLVWVILPTVTKFLVQLYGLKFVVVFIWCHFTCGCYNFNVTLILIFIFILVSTGENV